ncbi:MAG: beta-galactosidase trimerization domain-containing protein [Armatimonadota bacterium]
MRIPTLLLAFLTLVFLGEAALAKFPATEVPTFKVRARVVNINGQDPAGKAFTFSLGKTSAKVTGSAWTEGLAFTLQDAEACLGPNNYPNMYMGGWPVVTGMSVQGVADTTAIEGELILDEKPAAPVKFSARLYAGHLGVLVWREADKSPRVATFAQYNKRYWEALKTVNITEAQRPKRFPIVDRFIGSDNDRDAWEEGLAQLSKAGFNGLMLGGDKTTRDMLLKVGLRRTAGAIYNPPGYAFDFTRGNENTSPAGVEQWAKNIAKPYYNAGYLPEDMAAYAMSDEPGWYYPGTLNALMKDPIAMARFRDYLQAQGLKPQDVGAEQWEDVQPIGRSRVMDAADGTPAPLAARRLFYWTMRFFAWDSSRHFAVSTRALEQAFYPNMPIFTNFNFFAGRLYTPGPIANNGDKQSQDAAMGGHDWLEFGRMRGATMMWTEDWFGDGQAPQWSFYSAKLRCAAQKGGIEFGGYVIPRTAGQRQDGIVQKILTIIGQGGKGLKYFVFGPEYAFPSNCYSENIKVLPQMAEAHRMIGAAEELLWPGRTPRPQVAILSPRSAQMWDCKNVPIPNDIIYDATNTNLNGRTVDYMAEVYDLYVALQHANIPTDLVEEEDLNPAHLAPYKVLYVTEPNIPAEFQQGLLKWVQGGGTLVMVSGAGAYDRYNDPCDILAKGVGITEVPRERMTILNLGAVKEAGKGTYHGKAFTIYGPSGSFVTPPADGIILATGADGAPAVIQRTVGQGAVVYFAWMPGLSYVKSQNGTKDGLPAGFSEEVRGLITHPTQLAKVTSRVTVNKPMIETPMLLSEKGAAVTLLNWTGEPQQKLTVYARVPFKAAKVQSVKKGALKFTQTKDVIYCTLPLEAADILMITP